MKITFIHSIDDVFSPERPLRTPEQMQFGISYISALLKRHGHQTNLLVLSRMLGGRNRSLVEEHMRRFRPGLICFSAVSTEYRFISAIAAYLKSRWPDIYLLAGGPHVSLNPEQALADKFDALCIGEGEYPALELAGQLEKGLEPSGIANLWIRQKSGVEKNPPRALLENLDSLPFADREIWQEWIKEEPQARIPVLLGRGCPFQCSYCCNHALRKLAPGRYVRFRSPENILEEIREISAKFPQRRNIYLEVETVGADKKWALQLCRQLENFNATLDEPLSFGVNLRLTAGADFTELFTAFKKSNFKVVNIGVESGSERIRRDVLKRHYSNQDVLNAVRLARRNNLQVHFYNIIGVPGETLDDFRQTVQLNRDCLPERTYTHIFFPYPGTELYLKSRQMGLLKEEPDAELERCKAVLDLPEFSRKQIQKGFVWFDYYVYKGHRPMQKILAKVLISKLRSNSSLHYLYRKVTFLRRK